MKNKYLIVIIGLLLLLTAGAVFWVTRGKSATPQTPPTNDSALYDDTIEPNTTAVVDVKPASAANTIMVVLSNLGGNEKELEYEITYESEGLLKGVNSGSKPLDISGKDTVEREVYLGTCSRNVCKPDVGVTSVSVVLEFTDINGKQTQFTKDFPLE